MLSRLKRRYWSKQKTWFDKNPHHCMSVSNEPTHCWTLYKYTTPWPAVWKAALNLCQLTKKTRLDRKLLVFNNKEMVRWSQTQEKKKSIQKLNCNYWILLEINKQHFQLKTRKMVELIKDKVYRLYRGTKLIMLTSTTEFR